MPLNSENENSCCEHKHSHEALATSETEAKQLDDNLAANLVRSQIRIAQMDCPTEEVLIRKKLSAMKEVVELDFNLIRRVLTVVHSKDAFDSVNAAIVSLGMTPELILGKVKDSAPPVNSTRYSKDHIRLAVAVVLAIGSEVAHWSGISNVIQAGLALSAVCLSGLGSYKKGFVALKNFSLNINALMSIAVTGAFVIGQWPEAAMVMVLFNIAEIIEARSLDRARAAVSKLMEFTPDVASCVKSDGTLSVQKVQLVEVGSIVRARPAERIALDGVVVAGRSTVDQAPITGESLPVDKTIGDTVFAGTVNGSGEMDYRVTAQSDNTTIARIIHAVEEAQAVRAPTARFVEKFSTIYTPVVFLLALCVAFVPPILSGSGWHSWIYRALVLLVIACPCALVISTPITIVSGLVAAMRRGILVKGGVYLEEGRKLRWLALDKTGTVTHGKPVQTDFEVLGDLSEIEVRKVSVALASRSDHPVSLALAARGKKDGIHASSVVDFAAMPGRGVQGTVNGKPYQLGNHRWIEELGVCSKELESRLEAIESQGKTTLLLTDGKSVQGLFGVADTMRKTSREAVSNLHSLGVKTLLLTGDNPYTANAIGAMAGIDEIYGNLLPGDKADVIEKKISVGQGCVGMVGDGINDAPALARADIGFAMGAAGTDAAIETADVALMDDDLRRIPWFIGLSRATHRILLQNIIFALGVKAIFLTLTALGMSSMWMAVFADMGGSLIVVFNGLRLLNYDS